MLCRGVLENLVLRRASEIEFAHRGVLAVVVEVPMVVASDSGWLPAQHLVLSPKWQLAEGWLHRS